MNEPHFEENNLEDKEIRPLQNSSRDEAHKCGRRRGVERLARERDHFCLRCGSDKNLEGAHVVGLWAGGIDDLENVIALCHECHRNQPDGGNINEFLRWMYDPLPIGVRVGLGTPSVVEPFTEKGFTPREIEAFVMMMWLTGRFPGTDPNGKILWDEPENHEWAFIRRVQYAIAEGIWKKAEARVLRPLGSPPE